MADEKVTSNGNVQYWVIPQASLTTPAAPIASEVLASGINLSRALCWDGSTFPTASDSNDIDDRSILDRGNATTRGFPQFEASLNFFRPKDIKGVSSDYEKAYQFFKTTRVPVYLISRVLQGTTGLESALTAGQWVSVFKMQSASFVDDTEGEDSYKYAVNFLPQGDLYVYTQVKNATAVSLLPLTLAVTTAGPAKPVRATLGGKRATQVVEWASSNTAIATVSPNGVVKGVAAGTANITATHAAATGATTPCVVTVT